MKKGLLTAFFTWTIIFSFGQSNTFARQTVFAQLGSTGIGGGYQIQLLTQLAVGGSISYLQSTPTLFLKNVSQSKQHRVTANAQFIDLSTFLTWYPFSCSYYGEIENGNLFVKAGLLYRSNPSYWIRSDYQWKQDGNQFNPNDPIQGKIYVDLLTKKIQPFLSIGFTCWTLSDQLYSTIELGASYHGKPLIQLSQSATSGIDQPNMDRLLQVGSNLSVFPRLNITFYYRINSN